MSEEQSYLSYFTPSQMSHEMLEAILVKRQRLAERLVEKVKQSAHWQYQAMTPNHLREGADLWS